MWDPCRWHEGLPVQDRLRGHLPARFSLQPSGGSATAPLPWWWLLLVVGDESDGFSHYYISKLLISPMSR